MAVDIIVMYIFVQKYFFIVCITSFVQILRSGMIS